MSVQGRSVMALVAVGLLGASGCATVPKEAVQLSYVVGEDIQQVYGSYRSMVKQSFENIRLRGLTVIDKVFVPAYIQEFVTSGGWWKRLRPRTALSESSSGLASPWPGSIKSEGISLGPSTRRKTVLWLSSMMRSGG